MFEDDFIKRLRQQSEELERIAGKYDFDALAVSSRAIEQFRNLGIFESVARSAEELRALTATDGVVQRAAEQVKEFSRTFEPTLTSLAAFGASDSAVQQAAKQIKELSGTFDPPLLTDFAALRSPLYDFQTQLRASTVFTEMASHTLGSVDLDRLCQTQ